MIGTELHKRAAATAASECVRCHVQQTRAQSTCPSRLMVQRIHHLSHLQHATTVVARSAFKGAFFRGNTWAVPT